MRLDVYLFESGFTSSRTEAKRIIAEGKVKVDGLVISKPSFEVTERSRVDLDECSNKYVSRGGFKLEGALDAFNIAVTGKKAIDIGASTGGFTDCLLQRGAAMVVAVDSGSSQLSPKLLNHESVISIENYNARYMKPEDFPYAAQVAVMDVSFISATYIIPSIFNVLEYDSDFICLVKPQFEVGRSNIGKGGIVKDEKIRRSALTKVIDFGVAIGFTYVNNIVSPITGGDGNVEYLVHFRKDKGSDI